MTQALACYQDVDDVLDLTCMPNTAKDIDVDDILDLSYMPNTAEDIVLTQALAPMTVTPGVILMATHLFASRYKILFSNSRRGSNLTRHLLMY
jgi:hypothetical protein